MKKFIFNLSEELLFDAEIYAFQRGETVSSVIRAALTNYITPAKNGIPPLERDTSSGSRRVFCIWRYIVTKHCSPNSPYLKDCGPYGTPVCDTWRKSFASFLQDMREPRPGYILSRKDNTQGFSKDNCYWSPQRKTPGYAKSGQPVNFVFKGDEMNLSSFARKFGIKYYHLTRARTNNEFDRLILRHRKTLNISEHEALELAKIIWNAYEERDSKKSS